MLFSESGKNGKKSEGPSKTRQTRRQRLIRTRASHDNILSRHLVLKQTFPYIRPSSFDKLVSPCTCSLACIPMTMFGGRVSTES